MAFELFTKNKNHHILHSLLNRKWIEKAKATRNMALTNFAYGIEKDWEAVQAAIDIPFSNGLLEGTVNKIKAVKRQMYNRAGSKLLRAKILYSQ